MDHETSLEVSTSPSQSNAPVDSLNRDFLQLKEHFDGLTTFRDAVVAGFGYRSPAKPTIGLTVFPLAGIATDDGYESDGDSAPEQVRLGVVFSGSSVDLVIYLGLNETLDALVLAIKDEQPRVAGEQVARALTVVSEWLGPVLQPQAFVAQLAHTVKISREMEGFGWTPETGHKSNGTSDSGLSRQGGSGPNPARFVKRDWAAKTEILTAGPSIGPLEVSFVDSAVNSGWNQNHSNFLLRFETAFADYVGSEYAMATSSCTGALHLALLACEIGEGDEVLVPEITWVASGSAVRYCGATPVFVDIDRESWTVDERSLRNAITSRTKAIMPVHLYGVPANMDAVMAIAEEYNLVVVEDAAPAIGADWGSKKTGTFGAFGCYSFQGAKMLVTGEGGMLVTDDRDLFARAKKLQEHGRRPGTFWIEELGYKYKMSNIQAALGLAQLTRVNNQIDKKRQINAWYRQFLEDEPGISFQSSGRGGSSIDWMTSISLTSRGNTDRQTLMDYLLKMGIDSRPVFPQMSTFNFWGGQQVGLNGIASDIAGNGINLPSGVSLSRTDVERVAEAIRDFLSIHDTAAT